MMRGVFMLAGFVLAALGFVGLFLPVLPTTPFLILAAACFARSSDRLENWLLTHPRLGPVLRDWRAHRAIPRRAKWLALAGSSFGFLLFLSAGPWGAGLIVLAAGLIMAGMAYVFTRPDATL